MDAASVALARWLKLDVGSRLSNWTETVFLVAAESCAVAETFRWAWEERQKQ